MKKRKKTPFSRITNYENETKVTIKSWNMHRIRQNIANIILSHSKKSSRRVTEGVIVTRLNIFMHLQNKNIPGTRILVNILQLTANFYGTILSRK